MIRKPATIVGFISRILFLIAGSMLVAWLFAGPTIFTEAGFGIAAAVVAPGVIFAIFHQVRLRRRLSLERHGETL
jgi:hypothetical protein